MGAQRRCSGQYVPHLLATPLVQTNGGRGAARKLQTTDRELKTLITSYNLQLPLFPQATWNDPEGSEMPARCVKEFGLDATGSV
eukprot:4351531-Amphidinium_carterae.2